MPKLSIIIPVYNAKSLLTPMIESVIAQTYTNWELLLVDDGSSDGSGKLCDEFAAKDPRIKAFHKANGGQSSARNTGLDVASGELITFADNDDIIHPRMYETLIRGMEDLQCHVSACKMDNLLCQVSTCEFETIRFKNGNAPVFKDPTAPVLVKQETLVRDYFFPSWRIPVWNKIYSRALIGDLRFQEEVHLGEDNLFSYEIIKRCKAMAYIDTPMYFHLRHGGNYEVLGSVHMNDLLHVKEKILEDIRNHFPEEYERSKVKFIDACIRIHNINAELHGDLPELTEKSLEVLLRHLDGLFGMDVRLWNKLCLFFIWVTHGRYAKKGINLSLRRFIPKFVLDSLNSRSRVQEVKSLK